MNSSMYEIGLGVVIIFWSSLALFGMEEPPKMVKRDSDERVTYTVEMLVVVDYTVYKYWIEHIDGEMNKTLNKNEEADRRIHRHYESVIRRMSARFSSISNTSFAIEVVISDIIIFKTPTEVEWMARYVKGYMLDAAGTLSSFRRWMDTIEQLPPHDHAMLFTRYDLMKDGSNSVSGLAFTGTICTPSSLSIVEDRMSAQSCTVATHELAHSLGAGHDGRLNTCSSEDNFIMSETTTVSGDLQKNRNSWQFSECSIEYLEKNIDKLNDHGINCLSHKVSQYIPAFSSNSTGKEAETAPPPDQQCETVEGDNSHLCRNIYKDNYTDFCALMYCSIDALTCNFRLPLDGTTCGNNQVCSAGYCMYQTAVVGNTSEGHSDKCPFGDQPGAVGSLNKGCPATVAAAPYLCYQELYMYACCHSCQQIRTEIPGCEYGDKEEKCKSIVLFDCIFGEDQCCVTCADYMEKFKTPSAATERSRWTPCNPVQHQSTGRGMSFIAPVSVGVVAVVMLSILIWRCRKRNSKKKADSQDSRQTERQRSRNSHRVLEDSHHGYSNQAFQETHLPSMNGFRAPGSRHEPVFQFDRQAKAMLSTMMTNKNITNHSSQSALVPYPGSHSVYPGSDVIGQVQPACRIFNLQEFGSGRRPIPIASIPAIDNFHSVVT